MVFSSATFLFLFLPIVLALYFVLPRGCRNILLLASSLLFYAWGETFFVLVMLVSVTANYGFGLWLGKVPDKKQGKPIVAMAVVLNLGLLIAYKYANFIVDNLNLVLGVLGVPVISMAHVHLPIGISFFTFQALSYVVDVYRHQVPAEKRFVNVALYIALFPQLIAGPIIRYRDVAAEIVKRTVTRPDFAYGVRRFIIGLGKKMLIANLLGEVVDDIHTIPAESVPTTVAWLGVICFTLQLYFDFSGYSDMAIGLGRMFGFHFKENFNYPLISKTLTEFWQRWHISLSTWFRDYLFLPLGGYRVMRVRAYCNLMIVFLLCGIWHGASWNFVLFGVSQGIILIIERLIRARKVKIFNTLFGNAYLMIVIFFNMLLFRAVDMPTAFAHMRSMVGIVPNPTGEYHLGLYLGNEFVVAFVAGIMGSLPLFPWVKKRWNVLTERVAEKPRKVLVMVTLKHLVENLVVALIFLVCAMKLAAGTHNPFIYFRF